MQGPKRKVTQAVLYELIAALFVAPLIVVVFDKGVMHSSALALGLSLLALSWSMCFNTLFEYWEARQRQRSRTLGRRLLHAAGFEGGLTVLLIPLIAWWLDISWWQAVMADVGLLVFFFIYAFVFQWAFDLVFGLPDSAIENTACTCNECP